MKYEKINQKPYCCTAACLEMILKRHGFVQYEQEDIAYDLGLVVPVEERHLFKKARNESKPIAGYGTQIQKEEYSINHFFIENKIPLIQEYHYIEDIKQAKAFLNDNITNDIIICLNCATLYDAPHANWGHMVLFENLMSNTVIILDPSPKRIYEQISIKKILDAIKIHGVEKAGGFWLIKKTRD